MCVKEALLFLSVSYVDNSEAVSLTSGFDVCLAHHNRTGGAIENRIGLNSARLLTTRLVIIISNKMGL